MQQGVLQEGNSKIRKRDRQAHLILPLEGKQIFTKKGEEDYSPGMSPGREMFSIFIILTGQEANLPTDLQVDIISSFQGSLLCKPLHSKDLDHTETCNIHGAVFSKVPVTY